MGAMLSAVYLMVFWPLHRVKLINVKDQTTRLGHVVTGQPRTCCNWKTMDML